MRQYTIEICDASNAMNELVVFGRVGVVWRTLAGPFDLWSDALTEQANAINENPGKTIRINTTTERADVDG